MNEKPQTGLPTVRELAEKVARVHGGNHSELVRVSELVRNIEESVTELREITGGFVTPEGACKSYSALFAALRKIDGDLVR